VVKVNGGGDACPSPPFDKLRTGQASPQRGEGEFSANGVPAPQDPYGSHKMRG